MILLLLGMICCSVLQGCEGQGVDTLRVCGEYEEEGHPGSRNRAQVCMSTSDSSGCLVSSVAALILEVLNSGDASESFIFYGVLR